MKSMVYAVLALTGTLCTMWSVAARDYEDSKPVPSRVVVTREQYAAIHEQMTRSEVVEIMCCNPTSTIGEGRAQFCVWHNTFSDRSITVTLRNGLVSYKTSQGIFL